jgi:hypothetical protein
MKTWRNCAAERGILREIRENRPERKPGLHLSDLIGCARLARHKLDHPEMYAEGGPLCETDDQTIIFFLGEGHHVLLGGKTDQVKSLEWEGIHLTPDRVVTDDTPAWFGAEVTAEFKTTRKSALKKVGREVNPETNRERFVYGDVGVEELVSYVDQVGGYCAVRNQLHARLVLFFLLGGYNPPFPMFRVYDLEFEPMELAGYRRELLRRRNLILGARTWKDVPMSEHYAPDREGKTEWQCDWCGLKRIGECPGGGGERLASFPHVVVDFDKQLACA